ncbi:MAG: Rrf2 family transcriptional regulator [Bdellovibrionaceae bacterium]|nr:Rrf2 family transcriptional regulator [Bdellovibrio sp.]
MNKMNKKMEYALMSLRLISQRPAGILTTAKEVSDQMHIPFEVTARVLQALSSRGLLKAEYGVSGGYFLAKSLKEVSIHDLNEMLEGHMALTKCLVQDETCEISQTCNIASPISNLNNKVQEFYKSVSLEEVLYV